MSFTQICREVMLGGGWGVEGEPALSELTGALIEDC